jgi:sulfonate transport system substrate-binding protein
MKKILTLVALMLVVFSSLAGCGGGNKAKEAGAPAPEKLKELRVTYVKSPLNIPLIVGKYNQTLDKSFAKDKVKVTFPDINSGAKQTEALAAGSLDICSALGGTSAILAASNGVDLKIVGIFSRAPKAFNIMVKDTAIKSPQDLKGKKVAGPKGTILHQILVAYLAQGGLKESDVEFVSLGIPESVNALMSGKVDAALVAGADVLRAQKAGATVLTNGEGLVDATIVTAVSGKFLKEHPAAVKQYLDAIRSDLKFMQDKPDQAYEFTAKETGLTADAVKLMAPWYNFDPTVTPADITDLEKTQDFLMSNGMQKNKIDIKKIIATVK